MAQKSIRSGVELAKSIKSRRNELGLTIEEAAAKAGVGTKTWSRYEAGESIRKDKSRGICRALNWRGLPDNEESGSSTVNLDEYENHEAWSTFLAENFGQFAAVSFASGTDMLLGDLQEDMNALSSMPRGSHIGQVNASMLASLLPRQFLMRYDYDFLYVLRGTVKYLRSRIRNGRPLVAHSVLEELALYLVVEESRIIVEELDLDALSSEQKNAWGRWIFDIFDDMDVVTFLYSGMCVTSAETYHFDHWLENQFYCDQS